MISVFALGAARIEIGTMRLTPTAAKRFGLLLFLAAERGKHIPRSRVREMLFSELEERNASHSLRELVYRLRRENVAIRSDGAGLMIGADDVRCDWMEEIGAGGIGTDTLKTILNGFLPGFSPEYSEAYTEWLDGFRASAIFGIVKGCLREIDSSKAAGDWTKTELAARACLALDPMNGHATIALAEMLTIGGSATQAAKLLDSYAAELGPVARKLAIPASRLRRRIAEARVGSHSSADFEFIGRAGEMRLLSDSLDATRRGGCRAVLLVGEPGIGKSRIVNEFGLRADLEDVTLVRMNAHPHDRHRPMGAFIDIVPSLLTKRGALGCAPASMEWLQRLLGRKATQSDQSLGLSNDETAHAVARSIFDLVESVASETTLVIVIDDAHWVDDVSLQLLRDIVVGQHPAGVFVLLTTRDEGAVLGHGPWGEQLTSRRVERLDTAVCQAMIAKQLALNGETDGSLSAWMAEIASGNPFYADSLLTHFRATGERFAVPPELSAITDQRVVALNADARTVLEAVVALGKHATLSRVEAVLKEFGAALVRHVRELGTARLIVGDLKLAPAHWLIAESVQRNAIAGSQRLLYRRIASVLESELKTEGDSSELWECAEAWLAAGESDHAAAMIATCAEHALAIGRAREAADLYYRAARLAGPSRIESFARASVQAAISGIDPPTILRGVELLRCSTAKRVHDDFELAEARARVWADLSTEACLDSLVECIVSTDATLDHRILAARIFLAACEYGPAVHRAVSLKNTISSLIHHACDADEFTRLPLAALFYSTFGNSHALAVVAQRLVELAGEEALPHRTVALLQNAAVGFHKAGNQRDALETWQKALAISVEAHLHFAARSLRLVLAAQYLDAGDLTEGRKWLAQIPQPDHTSANQISDVFYMAVAVDLALLTDDSDSLVRLCRAASNNNETDVSNRIQRHRNAFDCLRRHLDGINEPVANTLRTLKHFQVPGYEDGEIGDLEMTVLLTILRDRGQRSLARSELARYLNSVRRP
ncbi:MAG TPA: AAA family ATPase, partial [Steroidobacteraceae bacterium]|nr:AAA family ATPase [Steroidobacteraceae bacterium]